MKPEKRDFSSGQTENLSLRFAIVNTRCVAGKLSALSPQRQRTIEVKRMPTDSSKAER